MMALSYYMSVFCIVKTSSDLLKGVEHHEINNLLLTEREGRTGE